MLAKIKYNPDILPCFNSYFLRGGYIYTPDMVGVKQLGVDFVIVFDFWMILFCLWSKRK